jgi:hypothetical protein
MGRLSMNGSAASVAYLILAVFLGGVVIGVIAMTAIAVRKEDRRYSLSEAAPTPGAAGARWMTGFRSAGQPHHRPRHWRG